MTLAPSIFLPHGGGPLPILGDPGHKDLVKVLKECQEWIKDCKAIILVTAHWESSEVCITGREKVGLLYDYYGFPDAAYSLEYPASGSPTLAKELQLKLKDAGFASSIDNKRDWDHGVYIPMMLLRPQADIPIVQVSVLQSQDPKELIKYGQVLQEFRKQGIAIVGSGMSYHKMAGFRLPNSPPGNLDFESKLKEVLVNPNRKELFLEWRGWKGANDCHPAGQTEHFSPLLVVVGSSLDSDSVVTKHTKAMSASVTAVKFE